MRDGKKAARALAASLVMAACTSGAPQSNVTASAHVLAQNRYWAKPGKADEVYAWRLHATDVQVQLGLPRGEVFRGVGGDEPDVVWQIELTPSEMNEFVRVENKTRADFQPVMDHMSTLVRRFEASGYDERGRRANGEATPVQGR